jgi:hypothetical protein
LIGSRQERANGARLPQVSRCDRQPILLAKRTAWLQSTQKGQDEMCQPLGTNVTAACRLTHAKAITGQIILYLENFNKATKCVQNRGPVLGGADMPLRTRPHERRPRECVRQSGTGRAGALRGVRRHARDHHARVPAMPAIRSAQSPPDKGGRCKVRKNVSRELGFRF